VDLNEAVQRIDVDALVEHADIGSIIARSSSGVASDLLDVVRSRTVGLDEFIARCVARLRRRPYTGPPGPPGGPPPGESRPGQSSPDQMRQEGRAPDKPKARAES
jgi:hypothetical protein